MSDTSQPSAPPPSAPPSAPPPQVEVPVDQTSVTTPTPLGEQAPPKPEGQDANKSSHVSRREALQQAFAKAREAQDEAGKARPAKPKAQDAAEKAERTAQPSEKQQRYREGGKFAKDPAKAEGQLPNAAKPGQLLPEGQQEGAQPQPAPPKPLDKAAPYREPPGRFSEQAKTEWAAAPESVRGAVYTMAKEFQGAYEKFRGSHEVMSELEPYQELVTKQGTSLRKAFDNYYSMEQKLHSDLVGGVDVIIQNMSRAHGWKGPHGGPLNVQDFAMHVLSQTPEQRQISQQRNHQTSAEMQIGQLHQQVEQQNQMLQKMVYDQKVTATRSEVDKFAERHPRFDELADLIKTELDHGYPLEVAYQRADRLRPHTQAAQTRSTPAQTRKTSISGAPDNGGRSANTRPSDGQRRQGGEAKHPTRREALAKAMRRVGNGV